MKLKLGTKPGKWNHRVSFFLFLRNGKQQLFMQPRLCWSIRSEQYQLPNITRFICCSLFSFSKTMKRWKSANQLISNHTFIRLPQLSGLLQSLTGITLPFRFRRSAMVWSDCSKSCAKVLEWNSISLLCVQNIWCRTLEQFHFNLIHNFASMHSKPSKF